MRRGTTPTHTFTVDTDEIDLDSMSEIYVTYSQMGAEVIDKDIDDLTLDSEAGTITVTLTQEDTLNLRPGKVEIQVRLKNTADVAMASDIISTTAYKILKDGEI